MSGIQRRTVLAIAGAAALGAAAGGVGVGAFLRDREAQPSTPPTVRERISYERWLQRRTAPYFIAHRGAGDVAPEHTLPSYQRAFEWGAAAIEISVVRSADDEIYCLHDLTLDRTTTSSGPADEQSSESLDDVRVTIPRLGPRWVGANMPVLPRLSDVLRVIGGFAVLCLEAKDDDAYPLMTKVIEDSGLQDTVMIKLPGTSTARLKVVQGRWIPDLCLSRTPQDGHRRRRSTSSVRSSTQIATLWSCPPEPSGISSRRHWSAGRWTLGFPCGSFRCTAGMRCSTFRCLASKG